MGTIIPSINCPEKDNECIETRLRAAESFGDVEWVHLDVADGVFTFHKTWNDPASWRQFSSAVSLEVHLMVEHPERVIDEWITAGAKRIIVHVSAVTEETYRDIIAKTEATGVEIMLGLNPETDPHEAKPYVRDRAMFLVLGVHPGLSGQRFLPLVYEKITLLRELYPDAIIEVDGGVTPNTGEGAVRAGANILVSASYIFESTSPQTAYEELKSLYT